MALNWPALGFHALRLPEASLGQLTALRKLLFEFGDAGFGG
jgi:hypothetical protein